MTKTANDKTPSEEFAEILAAADDVLLAKIIMAMQEIIEARQT